MSRTPFFFALTFCALLPILSCGSGGSARAGAESQGNFLLESSNLKDGAVWQLNKLIELKFNNPVDMDTVHFGTILFHSSQTNQPVTGSFEVDASDPSLIYFRPTCPTSEANSNGGLMPGGMAYTMTLPTDSRYGATVLRDREGRALQKGFVRSFAVPVWNGLKG